MSVLLIREFFQLSKLLVFIANPGVSVDSNCYDFLGQIIQGASLS
jgi:hypothetical protein